MTKKIVFLFLILAIKLIQCIRITDFCFKISTNNENMKCKEINKKYKYNCQSALCSIDRNSCHSILLFSTVGKHTNNNLFESFVNSINECPKYEFDLNDACLNSNNDCSFLSYHRLSLWSSQKKQGSCKCKGKYNIKCNRDYCVSNRWACEELFINKSLVIKNKCKILN